jgi:hypothetical protein
MRDARELAKVLRSGTGISGTEAEAIATALDRLADIEASTERAGVSPRATAAIPFLRESFRNDGAEGESVHLVCDGLLGAVKRLADIERARAEGTSELAKRAAELAPIYREKHARIPPSILASTALDVAMICERLVEVELTAKALEFQNRVVDKKEKRLAELEAIWAEHQPNCELGGKLSAARDRLLEISTARIAELEAALRKWTVRRFEPKHMCDVWELHPIAAEALKEKK